MNGKPVLVIMAAGMGSRYGGLKQIDSIDAYGNKIIDYSILTRLRLDLKRLFLLLRSPLRKNSGRTLETA